MAKKRDKAKTFATLLGINKKAPAVTMLPGGSGAISS
jgi:hypothetical protein